jgi:hypothetical protein
MHNALTCNRNLSDTILTLSLKYIGYRRRWIGMIWVLLYETENRYYLR